MGKFLVPRFLYEFLVQETWTGQPSALHKILVLGRGNNNCDEDDNNDKCADKTENKTLFKELETGTHQLTIQNAEHQQPHLWDPTV